MICAYDLGRRQIEAQSSLCRVRIVVTGADTCIVLVLTAREPWRGREAEGTWKTDFYRQVMLAKVLRKVMSTPEVMENSSRTLTGRLCYKGQMRQGQQLGSRLG